jgi:DNA-binding GntR family transcriptional regulator
MVDTLESGGVLADIESTGSAPSLADAVYQELVISIRDGKYHPGERIKEASVAKALNVSRTPVREAIRRLQSEGKVTIEPQRGAVVAELNRQEVAELYVLRQRLEGIAARFAAQHASDAEIEMMDDILERSKTALDDKRLLNQINWELHYAIYHGAHNRFLLKSIDAISDAMALLRGAHHIPDDRPAELYTEHKKIVDAIRSRDPEAAEQAAHEHIKNSYKTHLTTTGG